MGAERDGRGVIPGVYNYCDRWCERCPLASRCRVDATEMTLRIDGVDGELAWASDEVPAVAAQDLADEELEQEMLARDVAQAIAEAHPLTGGSRRPVCSSRPRRSEIGLDAAAGSVFP